MIIAKGEELTLYSFGESHPFNNKRVKVFFEKIGSLPENYFFKPRLATLEEISYFHTKDYINFVEKSSKTGYGYLDYGDTPSFIGVFKASSYVVGTTLSLLKLILENKTHYAFNPMGGLHHARRNCAGGFCVFNDIGVAIEYLVKQEFDSILYVDIDAHHGDGVYYPFEDNPNVYIWDIHEDGRYLYPGTGFADECGKGSAVGTKVNISLMPGSGDKDLYLNLYSLEKLAEKCKPKFVILQAGVDGITGDPLTHLNYTLSGYETVVSKVKEISDLYASKKLLVLGGGGYSLDNICSGWYSLIKILLGGKNV